MTCAPFPPLPAPAHLALLSALAAAVLPSPPAGADTRCGRRDAVIRHLETRYGETQRSIGLQEGRGVVEIFANPESGSWTILLTTPQGLTCLMAAGEAYQAAPPGRPESPA